MSALLSSITQPLAVLLRREKEKQEEENQAEKGKHPEGAQSEKSKRAAFRHTSCTRQKLQWSGGLEVADLDTTKEVDSIRLGREA